jgi:hypothetical protein
MLPHLPLTTTLWEKLAVLEIDLSTLNSAEKLPPPPSLLVIGKRLMQAYRTTSEVLELPTPFFQLGHGETHKVVLLISKQTKHTILPLAIDSTPGLRLLLLQQSFWETLQT